MAEPSTTVQKLAAEALGTFALVFLGGGSFVYSAVAQSLDPVAIAAAFGLTLVVVTYAFGRISGAHVNPAVTVGAAMGGRMPWTQVPAYVGAQLGGGIVGGLVLWLLLHGLDDRVDIGSIMRQDAFGDDVGFSWWAAFLLELVLTAILVLVILAVTDERNEHPALAPLAIGFTLTAIYLASIPLTGGSVNPARSIGTNLFGGTDSVVQLWLFIIAPLIGGAAAGYGYPLLFGHGAEPVAGSGLTFPARTRAAVPGYGAPDQYQQEWNQQQAAAYAAEQAAWEQEPIIQDGWQWDHAAQEWKPLEQWQPAAPSTGAGAGTGTGTGTATTATTGATAAPASEVTQAMPPAGDTGGTHLRTPEPGATPTDQPEQGQPGQSGWGDPTAPR